MIINDDVIASIDENLVDISSGWLWAGCPVYSPDYSSELAQPISVESSTLYDLRFVLSASNIIIRESTISNSRILWAGWVEFINDIVPQITNHNDLSNIQGGGFGEYYHLSASTYGYLTSLSANVQSQLINLSATKADKSIIISAGTGLTGGGSLSANRTISLATTGTSGTYTKVNTDIYGRVISGGFLTSSDIPTLEAIRVTPTKFLQTIPSQTWTINHNLDRYPNVAIRLTTTGYEGYRVEPTIFYTDENQMILTFSQMYTGSAHLI